MVYKAETYVKFLESLAGVEDVPGKGEHVVVRFRREVPGDTFARALTRAMQSGRIIDGPKASDDNEFLSVLRHAETMAVVETYGVTDAKGRLAEFFVIRAKTANRPVIGGEIDRGRMFRDAMRLVT